MRLKLYDPDGSVITTINCDTDDYWEACNYGLWLGQQAPFIDDFDVLDDPYLDAHMEAA